MSPSPIGRYAVAQSLEIRQPSDTGPRLPPGSPADDAWHSAHLNLSRRRTLECELAFFILTIVVAFALQKLFGVTL